jgi:hypothetical protein
LASNPRPHDANAARGKSQGSPKHHPNPG